MTGRVSAAVVPEGDHAWLMLTALGPGAFTVVDGGAICRANALGPIVLATDCDEEDPA